MRHTSRDAHPGIEPGKLIDMDARRTRQRTGNILPILSGVAAILG